MSIDMLKRLLPLALEKLNDRLEKNEPRKKGKWRRQPPQEHRKHASGHWNSLCQGYKDDDHRLGTVIRIMMEVQLEEEAKLK